MRASGIRLVLAFMLAVAGVRFGLEVLSYLAPGYGEDFAKHWVAPRALAAGEDPYDPAVTKRLAESLDVMASDRTYFHYLERFHYPPLDLLVFRPLSLLPLRAATVVWILLSSLLYLASIPLLLDVLGFERRSAEAGLMIAALLGFAPALGTMSLGQLEIAVFFALVLGLWLEERGRPVAAGLAIAVAIHIKVFPAVLVLFYLLLRRWRMVASIAAWTVALAAACLWAVGPQACGAWLLAESRYGALESGWEQYLPSNLSIPAFLMKAAAFLSGGHEAAGIAIAIGRVAMVALLAVASFAVVRAARGGRDETLWALGALFTATSMASPLTFQHHLVWLALPLGLALKEAWAAQDARRMALTFVLPYLLIGTLDPWNQSLRDLTGDLPKGWRDVLWSIIPAAIASGALWLGVYAVRRASRPQPSPR